VKADGSIVAWGDNFSGECDVPAPNTGFVAVAAHRHYDTGYSIATAYSLGLKADGSIVAWGDNFYGQCNVPAPNTAFVAVAAGESHALGLKADGSVVAWGDNTYGQCELPSPNSGFVAIAAGGTQSLALKAGRGDLNCDGAVNAFDIEGLVLALLDPAGYAQRYPTCDLNLADLNGDGAVDAFDIEPFIELMSAP
jgi:lysophospholipase L1-like esterase